MPTLGAARWPDLDGRPSVLVPIGSTEQHGPHLPLLTDTIIAEAVAHRVAAHTGHWVAPAVCIGASGEHQGFPGVLSIGTDVLTTVVVELTRSISLWASDITFINGHGGNVVALGRAVSQLRHEGHNVRWLPCAVQGDAHAGFTETSLMLHLAPDSVEVHAAVAGNRTSIGELMPLLLTHGVRALSPNGVLGDPAGANADAGRKLLDLIIAEIRDALAS